MMAGHALLHILSNFGVVIFSSVKITRFFFIFPLLVVFIITFLEIGIAILQAYVFAVLLCIYFNDVYSLESH
jgi:F0F1-type ATP synthase membrane subunit a